MSNVEFGCLPTIIGSMPHTDPEAACAQITRYLKDIPAWPQLPKRSFLENMYVQYSQGFPGIVVESGSLYVNRQPDLDTPLEQLYAAYLANDIDKYAIRPNYAAGLASFLSMENLSPLAAKGQLIGPVSWAMVVSDYDRQLVVYDDTLVDAAAKLLRLKAGWQEKQLRKISKNTIIFVDEPYMVSFGSGYVQLSKEKVIELLEEVLGGISGLKGIHCCGNTDWSVLLNTSVDIISFDAYNYAQSLSLYPEDINKLLERNGAIAWGIIPNNEESLAKETVASLQDRLEEAMAPFTRDGVRFKQLIEQGLLTPSCGLGSMASPEAAEQVLKLLAELSAKIRQRYL
ncbi:methionine synthase [Chloroflexota bacterium]